MTTTLSHVAKLERLSPIVYRILGCNPNSYTLQGTNTYLIGNGNERILIDAGDPNVHEYTTNLKTTLTSEKTTIGQIICTHWHHDHVGGVKDVLEKVCNKLLMLEQLNPQSLNNERQLKIYKIKRTDQPDDTTCAPNGYEFIGDGHQFKTEGATLRVIHTPGHTTDHMSLLLEEENTIFSGDCVLGEGTTVFEDLFTYMKSLDVLLNMKPKRIYPGHGPVIEDPTAKLTEYITHRNKRETQIIDYLGKQTNPIDIMSIVDGVYGGLPLPLKMGAASNVSHHLSKLIKEGRVTEASDRMYKI